ncbi:hypothetical protein JKP88DRAFT_348220 [Tribonema minus]|uniref:RING-type domain-containing protein n=1 Tax=Tribonema minus TaxID=303371 RepID=A0A835Z4R5_9STRA|nr:hypothetical protein JKP88DRAFT_348220 [Tribonema minus]
MEHVDLVELPMSPAQAAARDIDPDIELLSPAQLARGAPPPRHIEIDDLTGLAVIAAQPAAAMPQHAAAAAAAQPAWVDLTAAGTATPAHPPRANGKAAAVTFGGGAAAAASVNLCDDEDDIGGGSAAVAGRKRNRDTAYASSMAQVLEMFPDCSMQYIRDKLEAGMAVEQLSEHLLETKYPKEAAGGGEKPAASTSASSPEDEFVKLFEDEKGTNWRPAPDYCVHALGMLGIDLRRVFREHNFRYSKTWDFINEAFAQGAEAYKAKNLILLQSQRPAKSMVAMCPLLASELEWHKRRRASLQCESDEAMARKLNEEEAEAAGCMYECGCCCSEAPFEEMISCAEGHMFCANCLKRFVEERLYGLGRAELSCMDSSGCKAQFPDEFLQRALPEAVYTKFQQKAASAAAAAVCGDALFACPKCGTQAEVPAGVKVFACPQAGCGVQTCVECGEEAHVPFKCSEVESKKQTGGRLSVEEAMTEAKIRTCPKCKARFVKQDGCNKMTITCKARFVKQDGCNKMTCACGTLICYICRALIKGYDHFCRQPHCDHKACKKCALFTDSAMDDVQKCALLTDSAMDDVQACKMGALVTDSATAMKEAGLQALNNVAQEGVELAEKVDVNKLLDTACPDPRMMHHAMPHIAAQAQLHRLQMIRQHAANQQQMRQRQGDARAAAQARAQQYFARAEQQAHLRQLQARQHLQHMQQMRAAGPMIVPPLPQAMQAPLPPARQRQQQQQQQAPM